MHRILLFLAVFAFTSSGCQKQATPDPAPQVERPSEDHNEAAASEAPASEAPAGGAAKAVPPEAVRLVEDVREEDLETRDLALQSMAASPHPVMVPALLEVLALDVDSYPIRHHAFACEALGNLAQTHPEAISPAVIESVTLAMLYANQMGQSLQRECSLAVQKFGEPAVPALLEMFAQKRDDVRQLLRRYNKPKMQAYPQNVATLYAAAALSNMRTASALEPFMKFLEEQRVVPQYLRGQAAVQWRIREGEAISEVLRGLADIPGTKQIELLRETVAGKRIDEEWDEVTDALVAVILRQDAGKALNALGDRASVDVLLTTARDGRIEGLEKRCEMLKDQNKTESDFREWELDCNQLNWMSFRSAALLSDGTDTARFAAVAASFRKSAPAVADKMREAMAAVELAQTCRKAGAAAAVADCYAAKLGSDDDVVRQKAAWELTRLPAKVALPHIWSNLGTVQLDVREIFSMQLYRMPDAKTVEVIDELLASPPKGTPDGKLGRRMLELLRAWTVNNAVGAEE